MKKLSKINEGMFKASIQRSNSKIVRKEDDFNINQMKTIDLGSDFPVLFADINLTMGGQDEFDWNEVETKILPMLKNTEWRMFKGLYEVQELFYSGNQPPRPQKNLIQKWESEKYGSITSEETNEVLYFPTHKKYCDKYWCNFSDVDLRRNIINKNARGFEVGDPKHYYGCLIRTNNFEKTDKCKIRLIKDK